ncbi:MAG TPA: hypothetical protein VFY29_19915 [Terriglobia bacterium]|nr:hypothetical protein [Terriglobia bacterium]
MSSFERFVYYHEFAHALQYWHPSLRFRDSAVRREELAADCVAAALLKSVYKDDAFDQRS